MKRLITLFLSIIMILTFICAPCYAKEFSDVPSTHWAYNYIEELSNQNIINGYDDGTYKPNDNVTIAQVLKLMLCTNKSLFNYMEAIKDDYPNMENWYDIYILAAIFYSDIYLKDTDFTIEPYDASSDFSVKMTRKEVAYIIYCYSQFEKILDFSAYDLKGKDAFNDISKCEQKYIDAIDVVKNLGIISGYEDGSFKPDNYITRAELAKVLSTYTNLLKEVKNND